jgi:hypothetical protein
MKCLNKDCKADGNSTFLFTGGRLICESCGSISLIGRVVFKEKKSHPYCSALDSAMNNHEAKQTQTNLLLFE